MIEKSKAIVVLAVICLLIPTAYWVRAMFDSYQKAELAGNRELILSLAESDANAVLKSGRKVLMANCLPFRAKEYPLLDSLPMADCVKESLHETICIGGRVRNDVIDREEDPWHDYEPKDHDPREQRLYAIAFNNLVLNNMATKSHCFSEIGFFEQNQAPSSDGGGY